MRVGVSESGRGPHAHSLAEHGQDLNGPVGVHPHSVELPGASSELLAAVEALKPLSSGFRATTFFAPRVAAFGGSNHGNQPFALRPVQRRILVLPGDSGLT